MTHLQTFWIIFANNSGYVCRQFYHMNKIVCNNGIQLEFFIPAFRGFCMPAYNPVVMFVTCRPVLLFCLPLRSRDRAAGPRGGPGYWGTGGYWRGYHTLPKQWFSKIKGFRTRKLLKKLLNEMCAPLYSPLLQNLTGQGRWRFKLPLLTTGF